MKTAEEILDEAKTAPAKGSLKEHLKTIQTLRKKNYSWRDIAIFLNEHGVETDHSKIFRFMKKRSIEMDPYKDFFVPTKSQYEDALRKIEDKITPNQMIMFEHHYLAHNRTVTFGDLADAAGFSETRAANLEYGKLGYKLGIELNMVFGPLDDEKEDSGPFNSSTIGTGNIYKKKDYPFQLVMHHELAKALENLGWFND